MDVDSSAKADIITRTRTNLDPGQRERRFAKRALSPIGILMNMSDLPLPISPVGHTQKHEERIFVGGNADGFAQEILAGKHRIIADEPATAGGTDMGPSPYDLLLAALGACTSMTVSMYARRKGWPLHHVSVSLRHLKANTMGYDCKPDQIERDIVLQGLLTIEQRSRLIEIANKCPIYRTLTSGVDIKTSER